jgi:hypothetical protein
MKITQARTMAVCAAAVLAVSTAAVGVAVAAPTAPADQITTNEQALAALDQARDEVSAVRAYLQAQGGTTNPPPTTTPGNPPPANGQTAAAAFNWGTPLPSSDEFNGTRVDTSKWSLPGECWPANSTVKNGRCASHVTVANGYLTESGTADGKTGWLASKLGQKYGRWEVRARVVPQAGTTGSQFHPVLITWPDSDAWPSGGEYDFFEVNSRDTRATAFLHHPTQSGVVQDEYHSGPLDLTQWHNYGFEWTASGLTGFIDGVQWFRNTAPGVQAPGPMHLTIQLDNFVGKSGLQPTHFDVDWARIYKVTS